MIYFYGYSHAAETLRAAAIANGIKVVEDEREARLVFVSQDTPTDETGIRDIDTVKDWVKRSAWLGIPIVLTSQVPPGFTRALDMPNVFHMAETLRMKDAMQRALRPEQFIIGVSDPKEYTLPTELMTYIYAHRPNRVLVMSYEEAEFAKIAINMFLAAQVDTANRLSAAAEKVGAKWPAVCDALRSDHRIGPGAYLTPGRWQDSRHLLRDHITLEEILAR